MTHNVLERGESLHREIPTIIAELVKTKVIKQIDLHSLRDSQSGEISLCRWEVMKDDEYGDVYEMSSKLFRNDVLTWEGKLLR